MNIDLPVSREHIVGCLTATEPLRNMAIYEVTISKNKIFGNLNAGPGAVRFVCDVPLVVKCDYQVPRRTFAVDQFVGILHDESETDYSGLCSIDLNDESLGIKFGCEVG